MMAGLFILGCVAFVAAHFWGGWQEGAALRDLRREQKERRASRELPRITRKRH